MNYQQKNGSAGKILSFHYKNKWILSATIVLSVMGFLNIFLPDEVMGWGVMFFVSSPYPILILFAWLFTIRSR